IQKGVQGVRKTRALCCPMSSKLNQDFASEQGQKVVAMSSLRFCWRDVSAVLYLWSSGEVLLITLSEQRANPRKNSLTSEVGNSKPQSPCKTVMLDARKSQQNQRHAFFGAIGKSRMQVAPWCRESFFFPLKPPRRKAVRFGDFDKNADPEFWPPRRAFFFFYFFWCPQFPPRNGDSMEAIPAAHGSL